MAVCLYGNSFILGWFYVIPVSKSRQGGHGETDKRVICRSGCSDAEHGGAGRTGSATYMNVNEMSLWDGGESSVEFVGHGVLSGRNKAPE